MKVRLTELCEFGEPGDVVEPDMPDIANLLIQRGVGVPCQATDPGPAGAGEPSSGQPNPSPAIRRPTRRTRVSA
jgi:hypothetical protein